MATSRPKSSSTSTSKNRPVIFESVSRGEDSYNEWKYKLDEFVVPVCNGSLTASSMKNAFGITEMIAYISDSRLDKLKAFAFLSSIKSGSTIDRKKKSVKFLQLQIICSSKQRKGYGTKLLDEIEFKGKHDEFTYILIDSPTEDAIPFYLKQGYEYLEKGTIDSIIQYDCCWKKLS